MPRFWIQRHVGFDIALFGVKPREKFPKIRVALALALFFAAAVVGAFQSSKGDGEAHGTIVEVRRELPGSCAIIATEAYHRLAASAAWASLLHLEVNDGKNVIGHMIVVWQVSDTAPLLAYDTYIWTGTIELNTRQRDPNAIAAALAVQFNRIQPTGAHFI